MGFLGIASDGFWTRPLRRQTTIASQLIGMGKRGILLDGPARVDIGRRSKLPVVVAQVGTGVDFDQADVSREGMLVAVDQVTGRTLAGRVEQVDLAPEPGMRRAAVKAVGAMMWPCDVRRRLDLPWAPGRWRLSAHLRERAAAVLDVELFRDPPELEPQEVESWLAGERRARLTTFPPDIDGADDPDGPALPKQPGVGLAIDRVQVLRPGAPLHVRLAFRLPARPWERLAPPPDAADGPPMTAIVAVGLVVTGTEVAGPWATTLRLPSWTPIAADDPAPVVTGRARLDLHGLGLPRQPQLHHAWAFAYQHVGGPAPFTLLRREDVLDR